MRNGECGITKNGQKYCMKNGRVRFVKGTAKKVGNAPVSGQKLSNISDLVGVSMGALHRLAAGVSKCITVVTPSGVKSICNKMTGAKRKSVSGARRKKRRAKR